MSSTGYPIYDLDSCPNCGKFHCECPPLEQKEKKVKRVFLGGTCNGSKYREALIPLLKIEYFNPVVPNWTPECQEEEIRQRETCDFCLYVITPKMNGVYSIAEVVDDSNKRPKKTVFCVLNEDPCEDGVIFGAHTLKSLAATSKMVAANGGFVCDSLEKVADFLNGK